MTHNENFIEIFRDDRLLGFGVRLTRNFAVTAEHCLRDRPSDSELLKVRLPDGTFATGLLKDYDILSDLALLRLGFQQPPPLPEAFFDRVKHGDPWKAVHRLSDSDDFLSGSVVDVSLRYGSTKHRVVNALRLQCDGPCDDHRQFSGSPIEREAPHRASTVLGLLVKRPPYCTAPSDSAFAVTIEEAVRSLAGIRLVVPTGVWPGTGAGSAANGTTGIQTSPLVKPYAVAEESDLEDDSSSRKAIAEALEKSDLGGNIYPLWRGRLS
ncbi:hypothetical protein G3I60_18985 [Streptomyces sp. SID13666]|uniref:trypsin-like peptidase domain-containing protein n=1 Tax=unclassified Streptomyces TaxID=2593676 RepID=UPI0013C26581|nr:MULTISPECIES: trypsin-like peptidase domain-containing protein [unclassified Streptomyces]NEA56177.1 hypothetical protein [Streptomyces sp. SID13666]NEA71848.1 hypothetical protein [Streptomyces sp. SID13588]